MKYAGMPMGMWVLFGGSFRKHLSSVYGYDPETAKTIAEKAKPKYKEIIGRLPEFQKATAALRAADRNPYSWNVEYLPYPDGSGYEARFAKRHHMEDVLPVLCNCDHLAMQAIHAALIREGTCVTSDCCDYCIVGDKNPMAAEYELEQADNGLWISEKK